MQGIDQPLHFFSFSPNNLEVYAGVRREDRQNAFKERQIDLIHVWREVNTAWQHGVELSVRKQYVNEVKGILLRLKNSVKPDLKSRIKKAEKALNEFVEVMEC